MTDEQRRSRNQSLQAHVDDLEAHAPGYGRFVQRCAVLGVGIGAELGLGEQDLQAIRDLTLATHSETPPEIELPDIASLSKPVLESMRLARAFCGLAYPPSGEGMPERDALNELCEGHGWDAEHWAALERVQPLIQPLRD